MMMGSFLFKYRAREALRGNWQTALVVTFFSGVFLTVAQVAQSVALKDVQAALSSLQIMLGTLGGELTQAQNQQVTELLSKFTDAVNAIPTSTYTLLLGLNGLALLVTPVLTIGCNHYFLRLVTGEDIGVTKGLFGRASIWLKALWLHVRIFVQTFLWGLLFVIPGVIASLRYSMAAYFMAEDPSISAGEALRRSREAMKTRGCKPAYFMLLISFVGWNLLISVVQMLLPGMTGPVVALVAAQFMALALNTYINASCAAFYLGISRDDGMDQLYSSMRRRMKQAGISDSDIRSAGFGGSDDDDLMIDDDDADGGDEE